MRKLLLMITLFLFSSSVFSNQTLYYYKKTTGTVACASDYSQLCNAYEADTRAALASNHVLQDFTCSLNASYSIVSSWKKYYTNGTYFGAQNNSSIGSRQTLICGDDQEIKLTGCTATCVTDPCKALKDQVFNKIVSCGSANCSGGGFFVLDGGGGMGCSIGPVLFVAAPAATSANNSCAGSLQNGYKPAAVKVRTTMAGQSSGSAYCDAPFVYTGEHAGTGTTAPADLTNLNYSGISATTEDGACPPNHTKGNFNGSWICIPDNQAPTSCPSGQSRNSSGVCVPNNDVGNCPAGKIRNTAGVCVLGSCPAPYTKSPQGYCLDSNGRPPPAGGTGTGGTGTGSNGGTGTGGTGTGSNGGTGGTGTGGKKGSGNFSKNGEGAALSGDCDTAPVCTGEPVSCALLHQKWASDCEMATISDEDKEFVKTSLEETDDILDEIKENYNTTLNEAVNELPQPVPTSSSCINDDSFRIFNASIAIPISKLCPYFQTMRSLLLLVAYLFAARIIFGSIGGGGIRV